MAKMYDVPADMFVDKLSEDLKKEGIEKPSWSSFVKTGAHADKPPQNADWWYIRCASILRKIYSHGPMGINALRSMYGGCKPHGYGAAHHIDASGSIIRTAIHQLEGLGYLSKTPKGRIISSSGMKKLDGVATEILKDLIAKDSRLKVYA